MVSKPKFTDSLYFVPETDNWHLKPGAPEDVVKEFEEFMNAQKEMNNKGVFL